MYYIDNHYETIKYYDNSEFNLNEVINVYEKSSGTLIRNIVITYNQLNFRVIRDSSVGRSILTKWFNFNITLTRKMGWFYHPILTFI